MATPLWLLLTPDEMAVIAGGIWLTGCGWVAFYAAARVRHVSTVDGGVGASAHVPASPRVVELPSEESSGFPRPAEAGAETEKDSTDRCGGSFALSAVPSGGPQPQT